MTAVSRHMDRAPSAVGSINLRRTLGVMTFVFGLLPWVSFGLNNLDTQPYTLLAGLAYLSASRTIKSTLTVTMIVSLVCVGLVMALTINPPKEVFLAFRGIYGYMTFAIALIVAYDFVWRYGVPIKLIIFINCAYLFFGVLDLVAPQISSAISTSRTTDGRGVTSLTAEPGFFAISLFFLSWMVLVARDYKLKLSTVLLLSANFISLVLFARSALGILLVLTAAVVCLLYLTGKLRVIYLFVVISFFLIAVVLFQYISPQLEGTRLNQIFLILQSDAAMQIVFEDASINSRLQAIVFPVIGAFERLLVPAGFEIYGQYEGELSSAFGGFFIFGFEGNRISSWVGAFLFELGIFGVAIILFVAFGRTRGRGLHLFERLLLLAVCVHAIPTNFPPIAFLLVLLLRATPKAGIANARTAAPGQGDGAS